METVSDFTVLSSKITADGDCSHEINRHLLLGRKVMTKLDSILKNRDITLPTKVHLVKAMVFPVVMYGCQSWTVKKAERRKLMFLNYGVGEDSFFFFPRFIYFIFFQDLNPQIGWALMEKTLESPLDCKEIQPVHPKGDQSWVLIGKD